MTVMRDLLSAGLTPQRSPQNMVRWGAFSSCRFCAFFYDVSAAGIYLQLGGWAWAIWVSNAHPGALLSNLQVAYPQKSPRGVWRYPLPIYMPAGGEAMKRRLTKVRKFVALWAVCRVAHDPVLP